MKVLIQGYLDNNIGDDLFFDVILEKFPEITFYTKINNSVIKDTFNKFENLVFINGNINDSLLNEIDYSIKIGGSMFIVQNKLNYIQRIKEILFARKLRKKKIKSAVIGSNYGPYRNKFGRYLVKKELSYKDLITVRDSESFFELKNFNIKNAELGFFDDLVYSSRLLNEISSGKSIEKKILGISVYNNSQINNKTKYIDNLVSFCDSSLAEDFNQINLFAFDCESENDLVICHHIKSKVKNPEKVNIQAYLGRREEFLKKINECSAILAIRFHSVIISDLLSIPYYPIIYSNKTENFVDDNGIEIHKLKLNDIDNNLFELFKNNLVTTFKNENNSYKHLELLSQLFYSNVGANK